jgi:hypothetical protein
MLYRFGSTAFARSERKQIVTESLLHALDRIKRRHVIRLVERKPDHAGRIHIGAINALFMTAGGDPPEYSAAAKAAIDRGYMTMHPSGGYLSFTQAEICSRSQMAACCEGGRLHKPQFFRRQRPVNRPLGLCHRISFGRGLAGYSLRFERDPPFP